MFLLLSNTLHLSPFLSMLGEKQQHERRRRGRKRSHDFEGRKKFFPGLSFLFAVIAAPLPTTTSCVKGGEKKDQMTLLLRASLWKYPCVAQLNQGGRLAATTGPKCFRKKENLLLRSRGIRSGPSLVAS